MLYRPLGKTGLSVSVLAFGVYVVWVMRNPHPTHTQEAAPRPEPALLARSSWRRE